jgi:hypothetical protein
MRDESFRRPADVTQLNILWEHWIRINPPGLGTNDALQHAMVGHLLERTGCADPRELTRSEAKLYIEVLSARPDFVSETPRTAADRVTFISRL